MPHRDASEELLRDPMAKVRHLSEVGSAVDVDNNIPPRRYFRSGMEMIRMANVYMDEGNLENAFILYSKFITLFVEKLPHHPDYKSALTTDRTSIKKELERVFPRAEKLKSALIEKYTKEYNKWCLEKQRQEEELRKEQEKRWKEEEERLKMQERKMKSDEEHKLKLEAELERLRLLDINADKDINSLPLNTDMYEWPTAPSAQNLSTDSRVPDETTVSDISIPPDVIPIIPSRDLKPAAQDIPSKPDTIVNAIPSVNRSTKPSSIMSPGSVSHMESHKLRTVIVPTSLLSKFLSLAQQNTLRNVETCGILTGKLSQNRFTITYLVVPKQRGSPDSCTTENEEEIFEFQDQHDLITLGWIHTHPSQTSFMSSVDLHTHCAYQLMLPEAIAIVCSPKYDETGVFSLTNDYGLNFVANCRQPGFHPHPKEPALYAESQHVQFDSSANVSIIDLR